MALAPGQDPTSAIQGTPGRQIQAYMVPNGTHFNMHLGAGIDVNLKPPPGGQWNGSPMQQTPTLGNGQDVGGATGLASPHNSPGILPIRTPSENGNRAVGRLGIMGGGPDDNGAFGTRRPISPPFHCLRAYNIIAHPLCPMPH